MLTISKPTLFSPDGLAARGQCNHDSPGWQLRWFDRNDADAPVTVWQGAFKTCRHLQASCAVAGTLEEVKRMVDELLNTPSFTHSAHQPTDVYPSQKSDRGEEDSSAQSRKKRKRKRH